MGATWTSPNTPCLQVGSVLKSMAVDSFPFQLEFLSAFNHLLAKVIIVLFALAVCFFIQLWIFRMYLKVFSRH